MYTYSPLSTITKNLDTRSNLYANAKLQIKLKYNNQTKQLTNDFPLGSGQKTHLSLTRTVKLPQVQTEFRRAHNSI